MCVHGKLTDRHGVDMSACVSLAVVCVADLPDCGQSLQGAELADRYSLKALRTTCRMAES